MRTGVLTTQSWFSVPRTLLSKHYYYYYRPIIITRTTIFHEDVIQTAQSPSLNQLTSSILCSAIFHCLPNATGVYRSLFSPIPKENSSCPGLQCACKFVRRPVQLKQPHLCISINTVLRHKNLETPESVLRQQSQMSPPEIRISVKDSKYSKLLIDLKRERKLKKLILFFMFTFAFNSISFYGFIIDAFSSGK